MGRPPDRRKASAMIDETHEETSDPVATCTVDAVHRRDHHHVGEEACHPHRVEVVHLGRCAVAVCHDCCADTGFLPQRDADRLAAAHRHETAAGEPALALNRVA